MLDRDWGSLNSPDVQVHRRTRRECRTHQPSGPQAGGPAHRRQDAERMPLLGSKLLGQWDRALSQALRHPNESGPAALRARPGTPARATPCREEPPPSPRRPRAALLRTPGCPVLGNARWDGPRTGMGPPTPGPGERPPLLRDPAAPAETAPPGAARALRKRAEGGGPGLACSAPPSSRPAVLPPRTRQRERKAAGLLSSRPESSGHLSPDDTVTWHLCSLPGTENTKAHTGAPATLPRRRQGPALPNTERRVLDKESRPPQQDALGRDYGFTRRHLCVSA